MAALEATVWKRFHFLQRLAHSATVPLPSDAADVGRMALSGISACSLEEIPSRCFAPV